MQQSGYTALVNFESITIKSVHQNILMVHVYIAYYFILKIFWYTCTDLIALLSDLTTVDVYQESATRTVHAQCTCATMYITIVSTDCCSV